jgi:hypothetical protein
MRLKKKGKIVSDISDIVEVFYLRFNEFNREIKYMIYGMDFRVKPKLKIKYLGNSFMFSRFVNILGRKSKQKTLFFHWNSRILVLI